MGTRILLFLLSIFTLFLFIYYSYSVARERWVQADFDTMVKLQDRVPERLDKYFSYLSLLGSVEITFGVSSIMIIWAAVRLKWLKILGWFMIIPATVLEVFGKLVIFHPAPPHFLHRTSVFTHLPSFYVHTDFSYPSGHMTRTIFILTILLCMVAFQVKNKLIKALGVLTIIGLGLLMGLTRVSLGEHWASDVIGGALLGAATGFFAAGLILKPKLI